MGLWTQIYTSSQRFTRQLRGGASRPGTHPRSHHDEVRPPVELPRFVCPSCVDPVPPGITCDRCNVESIDRFSRRRSHRLGGVFPTLWMREIARTLRRRFQSLPIVPIGRARGLSRVRGTIVSVRESVDGRVAWMRLLRRDVLSDVGSFVIRDESGTLSVGVHVHDVKVMPTKEGWDLEVGDVVELVGVVTPAGEGVYRTGHATLSADLWEPALLRPAA